MLSGDATEQTPPDLPSFLFKERIVYLVRLSATVSILRPASLQALSPGEGAVNRFVCQATA